MAKIKTLLVANRGEIALRIMRSARAAGIHIVAVYTDADESAPHVKFADRSVRIGEGPVQDSYLNAKKILQAAAATNADAIHPGYGFLSEQAAFARAVAKAGLVFVGPSAAAIALMGDKATAKRRMERAGVPCVPGYSGKAQDDKALLAAAQRIGFPLMVKASAGGGGRGMRLVKEAGALRGALGLARSEAKNAFGSDVLILEKAISEARHVEIQVLADAHGRAVHLGERDCSVQRRHQKVIEEAPSPAVDAALRKKMGDAALAVVQAIGYENAGTVEFLLGSDGEFYFLEMNTRLQVEHPVTEMVTGLDLVALQLQIAAGEHLPFTQDDIALDGHAIEVRLYAEDAARDFLPATGTIVRWKPPKGKAVRCDGGISEGQEVSPFYDAMLAKVIAHGRDRGEALARLQGALGRLVLFGVPNNRDFLLECLGRERFAKGKATTSFLEKEFGKQGYKPAPLPEEERAAAGVLFYANDARQARKRSLPIPRGLRHFTTAATLKTRYHFAFGTDDNDENVMTISTRDPKSYEVQLGEKTYKVQLTQGKSSAATLQVGEQHFEATWRREDDKLHCAFGHRSFICRDIVSAAARAGGAAAASGRVTAPMHGKVIAVFVKAGQAVTAGERLAVVEAMKMQHEVAARVDGVVKTLAAKPNQQVAADELLMEIVPAK